MCSRLPCCSSVPLSLRFCEAGTLDLPFIYELTYSSRRPSQLPVREAGTERMFLGINQNNNKKNQNKTHFKEVSAPTWARAWESQRLDPCGSEIAAVPEGRALFPVTSGDAVLGHLSLIHFPWEASSQRGCTASRRAEITLVASLVFPEQSRGRAPCVCLHGRRDPSRAPNSATWFREAWGVFLGVPSTVPPSCPSESTGRPHQGPFLRGLNSDSPPAMNTPKFAQANVRVSLLFFGGTFF